MDSQATAPQEAEDDKPQHVELASDQDIVMKASISLAIGLVLVCVAFVLGSISTLLHRRFDLGLVLLWANQIIIVSVFLLEQRTVADAVQRRMDNLNAMEIISLACQVVPWIVALRHVYSYSSFIFMLLVQAIAKLAFMKCFGKMVEIAL